MSATKSMRGSRRTFLKRDMERAQKMFAGKLIAQNTRDDTEKNYQIALQKQESAVANLGSAAAAITRPGSSRAAAGDPVAG